MRDRDCSCSYEAVASKTARGQLSWGIASARHTSGCTVPSWTSDSSVEYVFDVPMGPSVIRWNIQSKSRLLQLQAHTDLITCMRMSPNKRYVATTCYSGEVKLWNGEGWSCESVIQAPMAQQHHLAWRLDSSGFLIVGNGFLSSLVMYSVSTAANGKPVMEFLWQMKAGTDGDDEEVEMAQNTPDTHCISSEQHIEPTEVHEASRTGRDYHYCDAFTMAEANPSLNVFAIKEKNNGQVSTHLFSRKGELLRSVGIGMKSVLLLSTHNDILGVYGVVVEGGDVLILDAESLDVRNRFKVGYGSRSCVWDGQSLILPSNSGKLMWWSVSGEKLFEVCVGSPDYIVRLAWSVSGKALWMCGFSTLSYVEVEKDSGGVEKVQTTLSLHCHDITCCGVAFSDGGQWLSAGDLTGGVWAMQGSNSKAVFKCSVGASVRCLQWWGEKCVLIGCLDGKLLDWRLGEEVKEVYQLEGSVIIMRWSLSRRLLAVGSSKGVLTLYGVKSVSGSCAALERVMSFTAHPPQRSNEDMRFGQLSKQSASVMAEIWSLCWSPNDSRVATCSEDQTTKIWNTTQWTCETTLHGHTMAVTSVDWREETGDRSVLATCSDDRTVRVMDGTTFEIIHIFSTHDLYGWHTLTYLALHPSALSSVNRLLLTCTTQNGYVVVWDVWSGGRVACGRIHCGSVEGLAWNRGTGTLATVGADCVVHLFELHLPCS